MAVPRDVKRLPNLQKLQSPCHHRLRMYLDKLAQLSGPSTLSAIILHGTARFEGTAMSAVYLGNGTNLAFLRGLFFEQLVREERGAAFHPLGLRAALRQVPPAADLTFYEVPPLWRPLLPRHATIRVPAWVRQELVLQNRRDSGGRWLLSRSLDRDVARLIRRHGYVIEFTTDEAAKRLFFRQFYRPYVESRFGAGAVIADEGGFMKRSQGQTLARLRAGSGYVAGMLLERDGRSLRLGRYGAITDPPPAGVSQVLDTLVIRHAVDSGVERIVMGDSRPCLADGVLRYKAKFGATIAPTLFPQPVLNIQINRWSEAVATCLRRQPLIALRRGKAHVYRLGSAGGQDDLHLEPLGEANA